MSRHHPARLSDAGATHRLGGGRPPEHPGASGFGTPAVDLCASVPVLRKRLFIRLAMDWERREAHRLRREGQLHPVRSVLGCAVLLAVAVSALLGFAIVLYSLKSALGIDLLPGPSLFHKAYEVLYCR
jgi:hypothetical protein